MGAIATLKRDSGRTWPLGRHQVIEIIRMRSFTVRSERIPSKASLLASVSLMVYTPAPIQIVCLPAGIKSVFKKLSSSSNVFKSFIVFIFLKINKFFCVLFSQFFFSVTGMMKLTGQFGRLRFSIRHLFLFSASALLVIVTYRPYSGVSVSTTENETTDVYHLNIKE